jgi:hypothetical protein
MAKRYKKGGLAYQNSNSYISIDKKNPLIITRNDDEEKKEKEYIKLKIFNIATTINDIDITKIFSSSITTQLFKEYNDTNNGIILLTSQLLNDIFNDAIDGGGCFSFLRSKYSTKIKNQQLAEELINFCDASINTDDILRDYITNTNIDALNDYPLLKKFINKNKRFNEHKYELNFSGKTEELLYSYYDYNKDIVLAYEYNFIKNIESINEYILEQSTYLDTLDNYAKTTIYDYTDHNSFTFYKLFKLNDKSWINKRHDQGTSFLSQIIKLGYNDDDNDLVINTDRTENCSKYFLSINEWINVLNMFSDDLDEIINKSPKLKTNIYCYRGASNHYINANNSSSLLITENIGYKFIDQTSFTLIFDRAKYFYSQGITTSNRCIYRTTIMEGSSALFIAPLSAKSNELEILLPSNSYVLRTDKDIEDSYNNSKNIYDICSNKNKFKSLDIIVKTLNTSTLSSAIPMHINKIIILIIFTL